MKQLGSDLGTLRRLLSSLLLYDSVTFHQLLHNIKSSASLRSNSIWLYMEEAHLIFRLAEARLVGERPTQPATKKARHEHQTPLTEDGRPLVLEVLTTHATANDCTVCDGILYRDMLHHILSYRIIVSH